MGALFILFLDLYRLGLRGGYNFKKVPLYFTERQAKKKKKLNNNYTHTQKREEIKKINKILFIF